MEENSRQEKYEEEEEEEKARKGKKNKKGRRFSDEQIRSLESIFKVDTKLEAKKKAEVAKELGLQPRQVAIWFQNKRARWKSRQIEQDYNLLRANYDSLNIQFHDLKREKLSLQMQLDELNGPSTKLDDKNSTNAGNEETKAHSNTKSEEEIANSVTKRGEDEEISHLSSPETWCNLGLFDFSMSNFSISNWWDA